MTAQKLKAFTIFEMMVVMVITGIVIAASMKFYLNYENLIHRKNSQMDCGKETLQFYQIFKHDFDQAVKVTVQKYEVTFIMANNKNILYDLEEDYILRFRDFQTDTFRISTSEMDITPHAVLGYTQNISFEILNCGEVFPVFLHKEYSNDLLMNYEK